ncbi:Oidioi.mRNA.OKI2018_I69.chr2.g5996.t1.cds [Oikopleura dioica]|uniref:Oidioi.mRNA.OKI2018_I69.chr2.g5996.t1.cds n=1 Tax=Oikopleura dioica TaxID=34765 RepID=A0ABN7T229_OIKDI|nr:Oidioi.mRNA.OKI2018_I69.chr2.g5996.t1.cds [Oikopleura dioica]
MKTIFAMTIFASASAEYFGKIRMPRFEKLVGSEVDLTGPIAVASKDDCVSLCRAASIFISPTRQYDSLCDSPSAYRHGQCFLSGIPTLQKFNLDKTGSRALSCTFLCSYMSDCMLVQTETRYTSRRTYKTCSFFNGYVQIEPTRLSVEVEMKEEIFDEYSRM